MQRFITAVLSVCVLFFFLPTAVVNSYTTTPIESLSVSLQWNGDKIEDGGEASTQINTEGTTTVDFSISNDQIREVIGDIATGTEMFIDVYKGKHQDSSLYKSYSYTYDKSPHEFSIAWDKPGDYFVAIYGKNGLVLDGSEQESFQGKMRPWLTEGDDSGFEKNPVPVRRTPQKAYAQAPGQGGITWGKIEFSVIKSGSDHSSVAFIPGFQGSRLYQDTRSPLGMDRVWEPENNDDISDMSFTPEGESINEIFVGQPIGAINWFELGNFGGSVYQNFFTFLDGLKNKDVIADWQALPYDWRKRQSNVVEETVNGLTASTTYQMVDRVEHLASESGTGKVTLIGHSNGGLIGKLLMSKLKEQNKEELIDKFIMIGTPQIGTPKTVGAMLHGYDQRLGYGLIANKEAARDLAKTLPGTYGLLSSPTYFQETTKPLIEFVPGSATQNFRDAYGSEIDTYTEFQAFLRGENRSNQLTDLDDINRPQPVNAKQLRAYQPLYDRLSSWQAPTSTEVTQIVGWGLPTVRGFEYFDKSAFCIKKHFGGTCGGASVLGVRPLFTQKGDKTVTGFSADYEDSIDDIFLDIDTINDKYKSTEYTHKNITEIPETQKAVQTLLTNKSIKFNKYILDAKPPVENKNTILMSVHSPANIKATKDSNTTGVVKKVNGAKVVKEGIPGSRYIEIGDSKYILTPKDQVEQVLLSGTGSGEATVHVQEMSAGGKITASSTFSDILVATSTTASLNLNRQNISSSTLVVDVNEDGTDETTVASNRVRIQRAKQSQEKDTRSQTTSGGGGNTLAPAGDLNDEPGDVLGAQAQKETSSTDQDTKISVKDMNNEQLLQLLVDIQMQLQRMLIQL